MRRALRHGVVAEEMLAIPPDARALFRVGPMLFWLSAVLHRVLARTSLSRHRGDRQMVLQVETTTDGWVLTYETFDPDGKMRDTYRTEVLRKVDGRYYQCEGGSETPDVAPAFIAACNSLRDGPHT